MNEERKETERSPEEQAMPGSESHTAGMPQGAIEGEAPVRDPRETRDSTSEGVTVPPDDEQQVLEDAAEKGVEQADDDQRHASD